jgi:signal transduction histidine kinase
MHYVPLLNRLKEAQVVAMDIVMAEPTEDDLFLGQTIRRHGRVVLPVLLDDRLALTRPVPALTPVLTGHVHLEQGIDGVVREVYHTLMYQESPLPSFSSIVYETATGQKLSRRLPINVPNFKNKLIQLDKMNINYCGGPGTLERISFFDVLKGQYPSSFFKGKICLVGATAAGASDTFIIPFSQDRHGMAGVEVHANIINTLLLEEAITPTPTWFQWVLAGSLLVICFLAFLRIKELQAAVSALFLLLAVSAGTFLLFSRFHIWLAPSLFYFIILALFIISYAFKLTDAVAAFDRAYLMIRPHLRLSGSDSLPKPFEPGLKGLLTPRGLYAKSKILQGVTNQLIFEKDLTDSVIFSDVQSVILFGPNKLLILANEVAQRLSRANGLDLSTLDTFWQGVLGFIVDKKEMDPFPEKIDAETLPFTFTLSFPLPEKKFFKVLTSSLTVEGKKYPLFILSDISKIKELELLKGHVVSLVSHEIKTPLSSIEGFSELLLEDLEGEKKEFASIIQKESERLIRFLNTFLAISRLEGGGQTIRMERISLSELLKEVAREMEALAAEKGLTIKTTVPDEIIRVRIDRDLTKQCLINLVENAIKYSHPGKSILLTLSEGPEFIQAQVIDQGIGIPEKDLGRIFEKFYRVSSEDGKSIAGSGLGLTFVKEAVEAQGGTVLVESRSGQGSTFSLRFSQDKYSPH